jgi:hypothetical protein
MKLVSALLLLLVTACPQMAVGSITVFSDRTLWEGALVGGSSYTVGFDGVADGTSYNDPLTFDAGPFTMSSTGADITPHNFIGGTMARSRLGENTTAVTLDFDVTISAFGADFTGISDSGLAVVLDLTRFGGGTDTIPIPLIGQTSGFFGFTSTPQTRYESISFRKLDANQDFWLMDDLSAKTYVPEPTSFFVFAGLTAYCVCRRRMVG